MYDGFNRLADKTVVIVFERSHFPSVHTTAIGNSLIISAHLNKLNAIVPKNCVGNGRIANYPLHSRTDAPDIFTEKISWYWWLIFVF